MAVTKRRTVPLRAVAVGGQVRSVPNALQSNCLQRLEGTNMRLAEPLQDTAATRGMGVPRPARSRRSSARCQPVGGCARSAPRRAEEH